MNTVLYDMNSGTGTRPKFIKNGMVNFINKTEQADDIKDINRKYKNISNNS